MKEGRKEEIECTIKGGRKRRTGGRGSAKTVSGSCSR